MREAQRIRAKGVDITTWAVVENTCGYRATKFKIKISRKILIRVLRMPFCGVLIE